MAPERIFEVIVQYFTLRWTYQKFGLQEFDREIQGVPLATEPGRLADRCSMSQQLGAL
jgi:hypothetical protein